jgi:MOSC domain-containing protein YiiM
MAGRVEAIWVKRAHRAPMKEVTEAVMVPGKGIEGDVNTSRRRQVTIIEREIWDALMKDLGADASPAGRRANFMVSGVKLAETRGKILKVGGVRLAIGGETTPCERMDEYLDGLRAAMKPNWGGGAFAQVLDDGVVTIGDAVEFED